MISMDFESKLNVLGSNLLEKGLFFWVPSMQVCKVSEDRKLGLCYRLFWSKLLVLVLKNCIVRKCLTFEMWVVQCTMYNAQYCTMYSYMQSSKLGIVGPKFGLKHTVHCKFLWK